MVNDTYANLFSDLLTSLILSEFGSIDNGLYHLSADFGIDPKTITSIISGESVPSLETAAKLADCFETTTEDSKCNFSFMDLAEKALNETIRTEIMLANFSNSNNTLNYGDEGMYPYYDNIELDYIADVLANEIINEAMLSNFSSYSEPDVVPVPVPVPVEDPRVKILENIIAEFAAEDLMEESLVELSDMLNSVTERAERGVYEGWLPPAVYYNLTGGMMDDADKLATFSAICEANNVSPIEQLYAIDYTLDTFERMGNMALFSEYVEDPIEDVYADFMYQDSIVEAQAALNNILLKNSI